MKNVEKGKNKRAKKGQKKDMLRNRYLGSELLI